MAVHNAYGSAITLSVAALLVFGLAACVSPKKNVIVEESMEEHVEQTFPTPIEIPEEKPKENGLAKPLKEGEFVGQISTDFEKDGCPFLLKYKDGNEEKFLIPVQLEENFQQNGLKVKFKFHYSRIKQGECQMGQPAVLETIEWY